jgi:hypothetical protein
MFWFKGTVSQDFLNESSSPKPLKIRKFVDLQTKFVTFADLPHVWQFGDLRCVDPVFFVRFANLRFADPIFVAV